MTRSRSISLLGSAAAIMLAAVLSIDPPARSQDTPAPTSRPLLDELNRETQSLYSQVSQGIVRVQLPLPTDALSMLEDNPLDKWRQRLDEDTRQRLEQMQQHAPNRQYFQIEITPTSMPSGQADQNRLHYILLTLSGFAPNSMGVITDDQGHIMIPHYVDRAAFDQPVPVVLADGRLATASFVGSDRQTDLTVLKLEKIKATPVSLAPANPGDGSLVLVVSLNPEFNRLAVWTGGEPDLATVINSDGSLAGFTGGGQYRRASNCKPVVQELIDHGKVERAFLGVIVEMVGPDDPQRGPDQPLHNTPALRVRKVIAGAPADRAGLQPGDLILKLAGESVGDPPAFAAAIAKSRGKTEMILLRNGKQIPVYVDLQLQ